MITAAMIGYYLFAVAVIASVGYLAGRKNIRDFTATANRAIAELRRISASDAKYDEAFIRERETWLRDKAVEENEPAPVPLPFFTVALRKHTESDADRLPGIAALLIRGIDQLDRDLGGEGVLFDESGAVEDANRLTIRLVMKTSEGAFRRMEAIQKTLAGLAVQARRQLVATQDADIGARIATEMGATIPREVAEHLEPVAV